MKSFALLAVAGAQLAFAHFGLVYPSWRTDSLKTEDPTISQWTYPCKSQKSLSLPFPLNPNQLC